MVRSEVHFHCLSHNCLTFPSATFLHIGGMLLVQQHIWENTRLPPNIRTTHFQQRKTTQANLPENSSWFGKWQQKLKLERGQPCEDSQGCFTLTFQTGMPTNATLVRQWDTYSSILTLRKHQIYTKTTGHICPNQAKCSLFGLFFEAVLVRLRCHACI